MNSERSTKKSLEIPVKPISQEYLEFYLMLHSYDLAERIEKGEKLEKLLKELGGKSPDTEVTATVLNAAYDEVCTENREFIESSDLDSILKKLGLDIQKLSKLSTRKLDFLLLTRIPDQTFPAKVGELIRCLEAVGVSFDDLASTEDTRFYMLFVHGPDRLLKLHQNGTNLSRLLHLDDLQTHSLLLPPNTLRRGKILSEEDAIACLQDSHALKPG